MKWCSCDTYSPGHYDRCQWCHKPLNAGTDPVVKRVIFSGPIPPSTTPPPLSQRMGSSPFAGTVPDRHGERSPKGHTTHRSRQTTDVQMGATPSSAVRYPDAYPPPVRQLIPREPTGTQSTRSGTGLSRSGAKPREVPTPEEITCVVGLVQDWSGTWRIGFRCSETGEYLGQFPSEVLPGDPRQTAWSVLLQSLIEAFTERMSADGWVISHELDLHTSAASRIMARRSISTLGHSRQAPSPHR